MSKPQPKALRDAFAAFAPKLELLLEHHGLKQAELARNLKRQGQSISQKTISNIVNGQHSSQLGNLAVIADYFGVPLWVMLIPNLPEGMMEGDGLKKLDKLIQDYVSCAPDDRKHAESVAAAYANKKVK